MLQQLEKFYGFMESKKNIIRIMIMESLKTSEEKPPLFKFAELAMNDESEKIKDMLRNKGINVDIDIDEALVADFFTGFIPMMSFAVYRDKWSKYFHIDEEELKKKFFDVFLTTHLEFHRVQLQQMK